MRDTFTDVARRLASPTAVVSALLAAGCGAPMDETAASELETKGAAFTTEAWKQWSDMATTNSAINSEPTVCANQYSLQFFAVRNANLNYDLKTYDRYVLGSTWATFGTRQFASPPTCAMMNPYPAKTSGFILAGKGTDNTIYVTLATADATVNSTPVPPSQSVGGVPASWFQLSATQYTGANGYPAVASSGSNVVLAFRNGNSVLAYVRPVPFTSAQPWSGLLTAPALPAGATGIPAVAYQGGSIGKFIVMVRGSSGGLYWIYNDGKKFLGQWVHAFLPYTVISDAAMEWDPDFGWLTLYFMDDTHHIIQTSVSSPAAFGAAALYPIDPDNSNGPVLSGSPRVTHAGAVESGKRMLVMRGYTASTAVANRNKDILYVEDLPNNE